MQDNTILMRQTQLKNIVVSMKAEGYDVSPETQEACLGILEGRFVADTEVAKSIARFKKDKDHG